MRLLNPQEVKGPIMLFVAVIGLIANLLGMYFLKEFHRESLAVKGAFLHILGDTISSVGVIVGGFSFISRAYTS